MQLTVITVKRKISDSNGYSDTDANSPMSPSSSDTRKSYPRSFKYASLESSGEKTPKLTSIGTPKTRATRPIERIIRKSLTSDIEKIAAGNIFQQPETPDVATPMRVAKKKTSLKHADSAAKLNQVLLKKEQEFLTPKILSKTKERWCFNNGSFAEISDQTVFPRLSDQRKNGKEDQSPKSLTNLQDFRGKSELGIEPKSLTNVPESPKIRSVTHIGSETTLDDTQPINPFVVSSKVIAPFRGFVAPKRAP